MAGELAELAPVALRSAMDAVNRGLEMAFPEASFLEATLFGLATATEDARGDPGLSREAEAAFQRTSRVN